MYKNPGHSVVHLSMRRDETELSVGSGVIYERNGKFFIATAWHNFSGRHTETFKHISKHCAVPNRVVATVGQVIKGTYGFLRSTISIALEEDHGELANYMIHPIGWPRRDVAVLPIDPKAPYPFAAQLPSGETLRGTKQLRQTAERGGVQVDIQPVQACLGAFKAFTSEDRYDLYAGDDLFVLGYPRGIVDNSGAPLWKRATVASDPHQGWNRQPCFLIDCASRPGMSGAPVVAYSRSGRISQGGLTMMGNEPSTLLCGIYVGRLHGISDEPASQASLSDELYQAQIGRVWKAEVIDEIIDTAISAPHSNYLERSNEAIDQALRSCWPQELGSDPEHLALESVKWNVTHAALKELGGNAGIKDVADRYEVISQQMIEAPSSQA